MPKEYPQVAPIPYVKPTASMLIREGRHVDKSGMCYHQLTTFFFCINNFFFLQKYTLLELVAILQQVFAQEPPVYTKPHSIGSPQIQQQESYLDRPSQHRQSLPTQPVHIGSPVVPSASPELNRWMGESTALYNLNQGLAVSFTLIIGTLLVIN
jgi:ESCRT-I complex subunit TSG101